MLTGNDSRWSFSSHHHRPSSSLYDCKLRLFFARVTQLHSCDTTTPVNQPQTRNFGSWIAEAENRIKRLIVIQQMID